MKILVNAVSAKLGGAATYIRNLAGSLLDQAQAGEEFLFLVPPERMKELPAGNPRLRVLASGAASGSHARRWWWDQVTLRGIVRRERPAVLFSSANFALLGCPCPQVLLVRIPIYFSREYLEQVLPQKPLAFRAETSVRRWLVCRSAQAADCVVTPSAAMLEDLRRFTRLDAGRAVVNSYGVPRGRVARLASAAAAETRGPGSEPRPVRLLWVSHYADHKNLVTLLRAVELLQKEHGSPFELLLTLDVESQAGQHTPMPEDERELLRRLGGVVRTLGVLDYERTWQAYSEADVFVFPSLCESFGHPLVEAMAAGLPIVASDIAVHREICGDAARYFPVLSVEALAGALRELIGDPQSRRGLAARGRLQVEKFFWEDHVARLLDLLRAKAALSHASGTAPQAAREAV